MIKSRKQSSTTYPINIFLADLSDHITGKTGLTPTVTISKNGGAFAAAAGAVTEIGNGWYSLAGNATDRETLGELLIHAEASGADPFDGQYCIVDFNPFIFKPPVSLAAADVSGNVPVDTAAIQNGLATAENQATIISNQETINTNIGGIPAAVWAVSTRTLSSFGSLVADIAAAVWAYLLTAITTAGSIGKLLKDNIDGKVSERGMILPVMQAQVYSATASQSADVKIVQGDTPTIPFDLGDDYSGWTPYFGAKESLDDTDYAITPKAGSWSDAIEGEGSVTLTTAETATPGKYLAEIELRNGDSRLTAIKFNLIIVRAVITESET